MSATSGRVMNPNTVATGRERTRRRRSHGGIPAISRAGAISVNSMCCTMCW